MSLYLRNGERSGQCKYWSLIGSRTSPFNEDENHRHWMTLNGYYALGYTNHFLSELTTDI